MMCPGLASAACGNSPPTRTIEATIQGRFVVNLGRMAVSLLGFGPFPGGDCPRLDRVGLTAHRIARPMTHQWPFLTIFRWAPARRGLSEPHDDEVVPGGRAVPRIHPKDLDLASRARGSTRKRDVNVEVTEGRRGGRG